MTAASVAVALLWPPALSDSSEDLEADNNKHLAALFKQFLALPRRNSKSDNLYYKNFYIVNKLLS